MGCFLTGTQDETEKQTEGACVAQQAFGTQKRNEKTYDAAAAATTEALKHHQASFCFSSPKQL